jgi:predicted aspartyl protease
MGGKHFTIPCTISHNGYRVDLHALADTGANGFAFIDTACAIDTAKFLDIKATRLKEPISVKGFDGKQGHAVTHILTLHLSIDGRRQTNIPFCILDLGNHDIILGLKWMDYFNVWLDPRKRTLVWPNDEKRLSLPSFQKEVYTQRKAIAPRKTNRAHQRDADARDRALEQEDARRREGASGTLGMRILTQMDPQIATIATSRETRLAKDVASLPQEADVTPAQTSLLVLPQPGEGNIEEPCQQNPWTASTAKSTYY